jgi:glucoamylase
MNYSLSGGSAWNRLIEAQGFGNNLFQDASRTSVGTVSVSANQVSRYITFSVDKVALGGTPATGWGFTVTLTGQDGTHGVDQTRGFASPPQAYAFGVCSAGGTSPLCSADPNSVPKVLDTITATGTSQASELDYTKGPVVLTGVTIP